LSKRQAYVRVVERIDHLAVPIEIIAGVELDIMRSVSNQYREVREAVRAALSPTVLHNYSDGIMAESVEAQLLRRYPGRSYFIEIGRGNLDEYVQVYQP